MLSPLVYPEVPVKDLALSTRIPAFFITSITLNVLAQLIFGDKDKKQDVQQPVSTLPPSVSSEPVRRVSDSSKKEMAVVETKN